MVGASAAAASGSVKVRVSVIVETGLPSGRSLSEWEVVEPTLLPRLEPGVRDRLASRLSSKQSWSTPLARIEAMWEAGFASRERNLRDVLGGGACGSLSVGSQQEKAGL